jgi:uncharacterized membrane protein
VMKWFFWLGIFSLLMIIITGIFRSIHYKSTNSGNSRTVKTKLLILKHIFGGAISLGGTYLAYRLTFC